MLRTQNDKSFSCHEYRVVCAVSCRSVIANAVRRVAIRFLFLKGITDSFVLTTLAVPKSCFRLEREQLLTAAPAVARFFLHRRRSQHHSE